MHHSKVTTAVTGICPLGGRREDTQAVAAFLDIQQLGPHFVIERAIELLLTDRQHFR